MRYRIVRALARIIVLSILATLAILAAYGFILLAWASQY